MCEHDGQDWTHLLDGVPKEGQEVWAMTPKGHVSTMRYVRGLWFVGPEFTVYAYYRPHLWKAKA